MKRFRTPAAVLATVAALSLANSAAAQQQVIFPRPSPKASVSQTIGITDVTLHYSRPGVKERKIWGELVPYNEVWRTGANENTTITFSTPVKIGGKELPAGTYGLQTIPTASDWTIIFSKDAELWGAFDYKQENDALRIQAKPAPADFQERMGFEFDDVTDNSAKVVLRWEKLQVPFSVEVDTPKQVMAAAQQSVRWQGPYQAANYCIQNNTCLDEAGRWLDASIALEDNFWNRRAKAQLLAKRNDYKTAVTNGEKALAAAKTMQQAPPDTAVKELETSLADWRKK
ncbi:MAG TPA: DUF2911 domain-containing protein [Thermoanaerobaculia bacterium]|nr:DUF2911 domain-containing protein [Thermoanaerobaculia bacterium]